MKTSLSVRHSQKCFNHFINLFFLVVIFLLSLGLVSCDQPETLAPVTELTQIDAMPRAGFHRVLKGETLYEIAWRYGLDYRDLAKRNDIYPPYAIFVGQKIYLKPMKVVSKNKEIVSGSITTRKVKVIIPANKMRSESAILPAKKMLSYKGLPREGEPNYLITKWAWPTKTAHSASLHSGKGVNILGQLGEPIYAAGPGKVVYAGSGLRGYGNLIIIKHNSSYLSAYAHNNVILVKEGDWVKIGQKIAEMGKTGSNKVMLHFEIRRGGRPLNLSSLTY